MKTFDIYSNITQEWLGDYKGSTEDEAIEAAAEDTGHRPNDLYGEERQQEGDE